MFSISLRTKIFVLVSVVVIIAFTIMTATVSYRTFELAKKDAFILAQETAEKYQHEIRAELQGARITAETLSTVFETLKEMNLTDRVMMNNILKNALAKKEYITAFCIAYDPNALDGKDKEFADVKPAYDGTGRFAPYWNKMGESIAVEPLYDIDIADWYIQPKQTLHEYIPDPYPYHVQGHEVMLASLIFPIIHKGKFIGIISSDIVLDKLQEMVSKVNPHEQGGHTVIFSNAGTIVAHPDKEFLGKDMIEGSIYRMLNSDQSRVPAALKKANEYFETLPVPKQGDKEQVEQYEKNKKFMEMLREYAKKKDKTQLDFSCLTAEMTQAMLQADPKRTFFMGEAKEAIKEGKSYIYEGTGFYTVYVPIRFSDVTKPWSVAVSIPMSKVLSNANSIRNYIVAASVLAVALIGFLLYFVTGSITKPILKLANTAKILGEGNFDTEVPIIRSNDEIGSLSSAFKFMVDEINKLIKELQANARTLEEKNVYLNKLNELKDEFLANTSHELRTPINGIIGIVESMIDGATGSISDEQKYNLAIVANSGKRLSNLVNDILDFTKLKNNEIQLQLKPIDLKPIVDMVLVLSKPLIKGKEIALVDEIGDAIPLIEADENRIQQILYNLIGNAIKFTEKGKVAVSAKVENGLVAVSVRDTGIGIAADKFDKIFESFEQADGSTARIYGGTGLGLSITKKIVELHGGTIAVESTCGQGSLFTFTVPKATGEEIATFQKLKTTLTLENYSVPETAMYEKSVVAEEGSCRILVVDDEPVNIQVLLNLLSVRNYSVFKAYNGTEALELFEKGEKFDLVLLDVMMPKMSGYDVCRQLRSKYSLFELPIVMLTAKNQTQDIVFGFQSGANDYIQKPFDKEELLARVKTLLELKGAMAAAETANKTKALFLANMSHELRTPLNAVVGLTDLLLKTSMDGRQRDYTEKMRQASLSLLGIINNILDFSEIDAGRMKLHRVLFEPRVIFGELDEFFRKRNPDSKVSLRFEIDPTIPGTLLGDVVRLKQIFVNLIDNAYKFTEKGSIVVHADVKRRDPNNVLIDFAVKDTGIGMSQKQIQGLFDAFNQADNSATRKYGGTGIGLAITREMVELMGGTITVSGKEGEGTTFSFSCSFPVPEVFSTQGFSESANAMGDTATAAEESAMSIQKTNSALKGMRVLLVEDNKINAMIVTELLKSVGVDVTGAMNGEEALKRLEEAATIRGKSPFDLILMDLQMPVMDGYEATKIIKESPMFKDIPVYALTAHAFAEERERCLALGMQEHLTKPVDVEKFYESLRKIRKP